MKRAIAFVGTALFSAVLLAGPAAAHVIVVSPPGGGTGHQGWVGSPAEGIPGQGNGLVLGGPTGETVLSPAHVKGLVTACESIRGQGRAAANIFGPPSPAGCPHGT